MESRLQSAIAYLERLLVAKLSGMPSAIRLSKIHKSFGNVNAVSGVDLEVAHGEFFAMLGPSGSGKTTVLRMIAGFEMFDAAPFAEIHEFHNA